MFCRFKYSIVLLLFLILSTHFGLPAFARQSCEKVRLDVGTASVSRLPVLDQGQEGLCYAYTATQLIDAWRFSHGDNKIDYLTSPVYGGALYARDFKKAEEIGDIHREIEQLNCESISSINGPNKCTEKLINLIGLSISKSKYTDLSGGYTDFVIASLRKNKSACDSHDLFGRNGQKEYTQLIHPLMKFISRSSEEGGSAVENFEKVNCSLRKTIPNFIGDIQKIVKSDKNTNDILIQFFDKVCERRVDLSHIPKEQSLLLEPQNRTTAKNKIASLLSLKNPQPIGIEYCSGVLFDKKECGKHASMIVGREMRNGKCSYLIRNSWGKKCRFKSDFENLKYAHECDQNGQIWIPEDVLLERTDKLVWLE